MNPSNISFVSKVKSVYSSLRKSEKKVADYILSNMETVLSQSLSDISKATDVSEATVMRFCKSLESSGYSELKLMIAKDLGSGSKNNRTDHEIIVTAAGNAPEDIPMGFIAAMRLALKETAEGFDPGEYMKAVRVIAGAQEVNIHCPAEISGAAGDLVNKLTKLGKTCRVNQSFQKNTCSAAIGVGCQSKEVFAALKEAKKSGASVICITGCTSSPITEISDIRLTASANSTPYNGAASWISQLVILNALYHGVLPLTRKSAGSLEDMSALSAEHSDPIFDFF